MNWILPLALLILFEIVADILAKEWSLNSRLWLGGAALLGYVIANTFWLIALKNGSGLAKGAIIFSVATAVVAVVIGYVLYKESLSSLQLVGCLLGIASLVLIFWE